MRAEFWFFAAIEDDYTDVGWTYLSTDQVRFYDLESGDDVSQDSVPPLAFSEVMRDVDLFVGVSSVGNDASWFDQGDGRQGYLEYWERYAFGDLSTTAKTRKDILSRVVPWLDIADQCSFEDRFLVVKGSLSTYKIHLGSANIIMEPAGRYLCIVADRRKPKDKIFLPFEGDRTLALILSKAMLLANDHKIEDPTILSQIG